MSSNILLRQLQKTFLIHLLIRKVLNLPDENYETGLLLHDGAKTMLKRFGIDPKTLDVDTLRREYNSLYSQKETLQKTYKSAEKEINTLTRKLDNLNQYLNRASPIQQTIDNKPEKAQNSL